uniref:Uncharacterized protein n=1 Tax=Siphoviridae sp. ctqPo10 TaxID=2827948 RepID=A0A8S5SUR0_9CAUD|nr:MAG TPA: hypothetical protein [Siphoviridae sp. ctqPo10]
MFGKEGVIVQESTDIVQVEFDYGVSLALYKKDIVIIEREDNNMAKLEGYYAVAGTKEGYYGKKYFYAIYDDGKTYKAGDKIVVSGANNGVLTIEEIITPDECNRNITAEVICKVDTSAYDKRVEERKEKAERKKEADKIKKQMDKMITEMDQTKRYEMYASNNPELAEKLKAYKELIGE